MARTKTADPVVVVHRGIEITLDEGSNRWRYTFKGRERSSDTLALARKAIDNPPARPVREFKPCQALYAFSFSRETFRTVTVSSICENERRGGGYAWIEHDGTRSRVDHSRLFERSEENLKLIETVELLRTEIELKKQSVEALLDDMVNLKFPKDSK